MKTFVPTYICAFVLVLGFATKISFAQTTTSTTQQGVEFYLKANYESAAETLQKAVETNKKDKTAWLFLGMALARQSKNKEAKKAFDEADDIKIDPEHGYTNDGDAQLEIRKKPFVAYTYEARQGNITGSIILAVEFKANGQIDFVFPVKKLSGGLTEKSIEAARQITFEPARKNSKAITVIKLIEYKFYIY